MENRERYKRIIMFLSSVVIVAIETALFAYIWYNFYLSKEVIGRLFVRGNQVVIGLYVLMLYFFYKIYGVVPARTLVAGLQRPDFALAPYFSDSRGFCRRGGVRRRLLAEQPCGRFQPGRLD